MPCSCAERLGRIGGGLPPEPRCWIHAVSVGEAMTAVPLVEAIRRRWPGLSVVLSTVTPTGARVVADRLAGVATHRYFPLDLPGPVRRALDGGAPALLHRHGDGALAQLPQRARARGASPA